MLEQSGDNALRHCSSVSLGSLFLPLPPKQDCTFLMTMTVRFKKQVGFSWKYESVIVQYRMDQSYLLSLHLIGPGKAHEICSWAALGRWVVRIPSFSYLIRRRTSVRWRKADLTSKSVYDATIYQRGACTDASRRHTKKDRGGKSYTFLGRERDI